jgi:MFS family permease
VARAVQGLGGAVVTAVALSLMMLLFTEPADRAKAMGVFGFVAAGGGSVGVLAGGILTDLLSWHWIFLVNIPVGLAVVACALPLLPRDAERPGGGRLDVGGAVTVTVALMLAVYAIVNGNDVGWITARTLGLLAGSAVLLAAFLRIESRVPAPLMPLGLSGDATWRWRTSSGCSGPWRCSPGSSSRRSTCSSCSATASSRWA